MTPKIRAGYRQEATERITEQYEEGSKLHQQYPGIRTARAMATPSTRVETDRLLQGFHEARERWVKKTRQLLAVCG